MVNLRITIKVGDRIIIEVEGVSREFTFAGGFKDAVLGSELTGVKRFIINGEGESGSIDFSFRYAFQNTSIVKKIIYSHNSVALQC